MRLLPNFSAVNRGYFSVLTLLTVEFNMGKKDRTRKKKQKGQSKIGMKTSKAKANDPGFPMQYTIDELLDRTEEYIDTFEFELAQKFCQRALEMDNDNIRALETSGTLLLELGNLEKAKLCFGRASALQPDEGHSKYMYLGQLSTAMEAIKYFQKGIEIMEKTLAASEENKLGAAAAVEECTVTPEDISGAYCSIAEIYLTDACFEEDAEFKCKECLDRALERNNSNAEAYHLLASFYLSKDNKELAKDAMNKGLSLWLPQLKEAVKPEGAALENPIEVCPLSYPARISAAKILIELENYEVTAEVLELLLDEEDEVVEVWYLLGWANHLQGEDYKDNARYYLQKAKEVARKVGCEDKDLLKHADELLTELGPAAEEPKTEETGEDDNYADSDSDMEESDLVGELSGKGKTEAMEH